MYESEPEDAEDHADDRADNNLTNCMVEQVNTTVAHKRCHHRTSNDHDSPNNLLNRRVLV